MLVSTMTHAQLQIVGTYDGEYMERIPENYPKSQSVVLQISSAQDGKVAGKYSLSHYGCRGTYELEGTYRENQLVLRTSGGMRGCESELTLTVEGNKLTGRVNAEAPIRPGIELKKR
jgi:hypothetical protein